MSDPSLRVADAFAVDEEVVVVWGDGHESFYPARELRLACTCAQCAGEGHLFGRATPPSRRPLVPAAFQPVSVRLVGNYGLQVVWGDGHEFGIYHLTDLRAACPCDVCRQVRGGEGKSTSGSPSSAQQDGQ